MNERDEQRVIEALQALTGGLTVTEHDILIADGRLKSQLTPPSPRRRMAVLVAAAAAVVVAGVIAYQSVDRDEGSAPPAGTDTTLTPAQQLRTELTAGAYDLVPRDFDDGTTPTQQDLAGLWVLRPPYLGVLAVDADGDWVHPPAYPSAAIGTSTLRGSTWTRSFDERIDCDALPWTATLASDASLHLQFAGSVNVCTPADEREVWDRLAPGRSPVTDYLRDTTAQIDWVGGSWDRAGTYFAPETGHLLEVADDGRFWYFADLATDLAPTDQGRIDITGAAPPGTISGTCRSGRFTAAYETGATPRVGEYVSAHDAVRITATDAGCGPAAGGQVVWVRLA